MRIKTFEAMRPMRSRAARLAAVPYDTVNTEEARELAKGNKYSFLRVSRPEIEFPADTDPHTEPVYARGLENLRKLEVAGVLVREKKPHLYVYRQTMGTHSQSAVMCCCHVEDYEKNVILKHEKTRKDKEDDRRTHIMTLRTHTGPVFLTYRDVGDIDAIVAETIAGKPLYDFTAPDGIGHAVWRIKRDGKIVRLFGKVPVAYIADGHHRAAASARVAAELKAANPGHTGDEEYNWFMAALFPASQLQVLPYNRCVSGLNGFTVETIRNEIRKAGFAISEGGAAPGGAKESMMYLAGQWSKLSWEVAPGTDPVSALDVSVLQSRLLDPILGIRDPRTDKRIEFVGGIRGTCELEKRVDSGAASIAFSMHPVTVKEVMAVADSGEMMPPKSTWFEPKLRSGLLLHTF